MTTERRSLQALVDDVPLPPLEKHVAGVVARAMPKHGVGEEAWAKLGWVIFCHRTGMEREALLAMRDSLKARGFLEWRNREKAPDGKHPPTEYRLLPEAMAVARVEPGGKKANGS